MIRPSGVFLILCTVLLVCFAGCAGLPDLSGSPEYPSVVPETSSAGISLHTFTYPFSGQNVTVTVSTPDALYEGAKATDKNAYVLPETPDEQWVPDYYRAFATDPAHDGWFDTVLVSLRNARPDIAPGTDQYADYLTAFVSHIRYTVTGGLGEPKFPVETIADEEGDCDDKSILLAGLLSREGYNVSLFYLEESNHMAVGIAGPDCADQGTSYGYIEATNPRYIGTAPGDYPDDESISAGFPLVIRIGDGTQEYGGCTETAAITKAMRSSFETASQLESALRDESDLLAQQKAEIDTLKTRLSQYENSGDTRSYNRLVPEYNRLVDQYNQLLSGNQETFASYETAADLYNLLTVNAPDREYVCTRTGLCTATGSDL